MIFSIFKCAVICGLKPDVGIKRVTLKRFYYDKAAKKCKPFFWGGAGGNANNFPILDQCEKSCKGQ